MAIASGRKCKIEFFRFARYLMQNMDWLEEELGGYEDDYLIIDCPGTSPCSWPGAPLKKPILGQIELYTHHPFLPSLVKQLNRLGLRVCALYLLESQFMEDKYKFFRCVSLGDARRLCLKPAIYSGVLSAMSAMVNLEIPWINIMSKMDLVTVNPDDPAGGRNGIRTKKDIAR